MQTISSALSTSKQSFAIDALEHSAGPRDVARSKRLHVRLNAQFGGKMADLFASVTPEELVEEWADGLHGFHDLEVVRGLAACRSRIFPPTLGEFLRLCRPALDPEWAWNEAGAGLRQRDAGQVGDWSHPAVYRAACVMSPEVRSGDYRQNRTRWQYTLEREMAAGWGEDVPEPPKLIKHQPKVGPPSDAVRQRIAGIMARARGQEGI